MNDLEHLALVLVGVYWLDCLVFLRRGTALLCRGFGRGWQVGQPHETLGNQKGGLAWVTPLPVFPCSFALLLPPCSFSTEGVLAWNSLSLHPTTRGFQPGLWFSWEQIHSLQMEGLQIRINGKPFLNARSPHEALRIHGAMKAIKALKAPERKSLIEAQIKSSFDSARATTKRLEAEQATRVLRGQSWLLAATVFLISPALILKLGLAPVGWWLLGAIYLQSAAMSVVVARAHRRLYPEADDERFIRVLTTLLAPLSAIRSPDLLIRPALEEFHPLVAVHALSSEEVFKQVAVASLRDFHHPIEPVCPEVASPAQATESYFRNCVGQHLIPFLGQQGISDASALNPPEPSDPSHRAYCPRCHNQFTHPSSRCADCGGKALLSWPEKQAEKNIPGH